MDKVLVVYSGGLDSFTLLNLAKKKFDRVYAISFDYGQKHRKELDVALSSTKKLGVEHKIVRLPFEDFLSDSALVGNIEIPEGNYDKERMKLTVVPNRNMVMISVAASLAISRKINHIWYAAHAGDHEIYPDCRPEFINKLSKVLKICDYHEIILDAPFKDLSKEEIVKIGLEMSLDYSQTWTCYEGKVKPCNKCSACLERINAFEKNNFKDPLNEI